MTHQMTKADLIEMFLDRTAGESTYRNRLITRETDSGNVALIAYGWIKVAEYNESREAVTVFTGHKAIRSKTVSGYLNDVVRIADRRGRDVIASGESPSVDTPNGGVKYVNNYISMDRNRSPVENDTLTEVRGELKQIA